MLKRLPNTVKRTFYVLITFLVILALTVGVLWWKLCHGIKIARISLPPATISNLFLQFDQGLVLRAGALDFNGDGTAVMKKKADLDNLLQFLKKWAHLVQEIDIQRLNYKDFTVAVTYREGSFKVSGELFTIESAIVYADGIFIFDPVSLYIKPYNVTLSGDAFYVRKQDQFLFDGLYKTGWGNGSLRLSAQNRKLKAAIRSEKFTDLASFLRQFPLGENTILWITDNITAQSYQVTELNVQFSLDSPDRWNPKNIQGTAVAEKASIRFHPELEPVQCQHIDITFNNDRLSFALAKPMYTKVSLAGSSVFIDHVIQGNAQLAVFLSTTTRNDSTVRQILEKYGLNLAARQITGTTIAELNLVFDLPEFTLRTKGNFSTDGGEWTLGNIPLYANSATIQLLDNIITIQKADISFKDIFRARVNGTVDLPSSHADLQFDIDDLQLNAGKTAILRTTQLKTPLEIDYSTEGARVVLRELNTTLILDKGDMRFDVNSLKAITPFSPFLLNLKYDEGDIHFSTSDTLHFDFNGTIAIPNEHLAYQGNPVTLFAYKGTVQPDEIHLSVNNNTITASITDEIQVDFHDLLVMVDTGKYTALSPPVSTIPLHVKGQSLMIRWQDNAFAAQNYRLNMNDSTVDFSAELEQGKILFQKNDDKMTFIGENLDAQYAENFIGFADLKGGKLNADIRGDSDGYNGYLYLSNVLLRDYLIMNNVLAFLNAIPALATFSSPGFDKDGYRIKDGFLHFDLQDKLLTIRQLRTDGTSVSCEAQGWIDFESKTMKIIMDLITLKDYSWFIEKIPLAGYAILGEDGSLSTSLEIEGSLDDPDITTNLSQEVLMTPFNIIKRTIQWPFKIYSEMRE